MKLKKTTEQLVQALRHAEFERGINLGGGTPLSAHLALHEARCLEAMTALSARIAGLEELENIVVTIREEQVSSIMGFGRTEAEKKERANYYAGRIKGEARRIDDLLDRLSNPTEGSG